MERDQNPPAQFVIGEGVIRVGRVTVPVGEGVMPHILTFTAFRL